VRCVGLWFFILFAGIEIFLELVEPTSSEQRALCMWPDCHERRWIDNPVEHCSKMSGLVIGCFGAGARHCGTAFDPANDPALLQPTAYRLQGSLTADLADPQGHGVFGRVLGLFRQRDSPDVAPVAVHQFAAARTEHDKIVL